MQRGKKNSNKFSIMIKTFNIVIPTQDTRRAQ